MSEVSGVPARVALLGLGTEDPLEDHASNPFCWWLVGYSGPSLAWLFSHSLAIMPCQISSQRAKSKSF